MNASAVVIARDSAKFILPCLESLKNLSDDLLVVVDSRSVDNTADLAKNAGARVMIRVFDSFSGQKNYADSQAKYGWILSLDADETASPGLIKAIRDLPEHQLFQAYSIPRKNKIFGKYIEHSNWDPNGLVRFFNREYCQWEGVVHEQIVTDKTVGRFYDCIYHENYATVNEFMAKQDIYSTLEADRLYAAGIPFSWGQFIAQPLLDFTRRYILHAGFLDGFHGLFLSYLMAVYHLSVWVKLWQKSQKASS